MRFGQKPDLDGLFSGVIRLGLTEKFAGSTRISAGNLGFAARPLFTGFDH
jgi:hypothetical protein